VEADDFARYGACSSWPISAARAGYPRRRCAYLLRWLAEMRLRAEHMVWVAWVLAVAHLGYADLSEPAEAPLTRLGSPSPTRCAGWDAAIRTRAAAARSLRSAALAPRPAEPGQGR